MSPSAPATIAAKPLMARFGINGTVRAELTRRGARVDVVEAYRTGAPLNLGARIREVFFGERPPDWITFTSSSTVANFVQAVGSQDAGARKCSVHRPSNLRDRTQVRPRRCHRGRALHHPRAGEDDQN